MAQIDFGDSSDPSGPTPVATHIPLPTDPAPRVSDQPTGSNPAAAPYQPQSNDLLTKYANATVNFGQSHPGANPSTVNDPGYWARRIYESNGATPDWGYWNQRMLTPEGGPETSGGGGGGSSSPQTFNFQQALQYLGIDPNNTGLINQLQQRFGTNTTGQFSMADLAPVQQYLQGGGDNGMQNRTSVLGGPGGGYAGASYAGTNVFNDPATAPWEQLLNQRISQLLRPWMPPDAQNSIDFLRNYRARLTGSPYTPAQMDLIQTQALDPLTRQRDAARQQAIQWGASHGQSPDSGPVQTMLQNIDRNYEQNATRARSGFATNAIGLDNQNWARAAGIGPEMMSLEQQMFGNQENRSNQAVSMARQIPDLAWSRLQQSQNGVQQTNPLQAMQLMQQFQNQGYGQGSDLMAGLVQVLPYLLQMFGSGQSA